MGSENYDTRNANESSLRNNQDNIMDDTVPRSFRSIYLKYRVPTLQHIGTTSREHGKNKFAPFYFLLSCHDLIKIKI